MRRALQVRSRELRRAIVREHGGPEALSLEPAEPVEPGVGEVRVRIAAMALNHLDIWVRRGIPGVRLPLPIIPGSDGAGRVDAVGPGVNGLAPGERVFVLPGISCGSCRKCLAGDDHFCRRYEIVGESRDGTSTDTLVLPATNVAPIPCGMSMAEAASFPMAFVTAWQMLVRTARVEPGERVLVHAAASGVSSAGIQIARHLGATIAATAGTRAKRDLALELGADIALDYTDDTWVKQVRDWAGPEGIDVVFDHVGRDTFAPSLHVLGRGGRYVFCGSTSGHELEADFRRLFFKNYRILGSTVGRKVDLHAIADLFAAGRFRTVIDEVFPFDAISAAHAHLESRSAVGKVIVQMED